MLGISILILDLDSPSNSHGWHTYGRTIAVRLCAYARTGSPPRWLDDGQTTNGKRIFAVASEHEHPPLVSFLGLQHPWLALGPQAQHPCRPFAYPSNPICVHTALHRPVLAVVLDLGIVVQHRQIDYDAI